MNGDDLSLYVAGGADGLDLITGRYDLAGCLQRGDPLVVLPETEPLSRPLGSDNPARTMVAGQWRPRIAKEQWPFRLFLVSGHGQDDEMLGAVRLSGGRLLAEEDGAQLYGPLGTNVVALVNEVIANWGDVEARLQVELGKTDLRAFIKTVPAMARRSPFRENPLDRFSPAAELDNARLEHLAGSTSRDNLFIAGQMFESAEEHVSGPPTPRRREMVRMLQVAVQVSRAILVVGLRDLLVPEDADAYLQRWTETTGVTST